ncbi:ParD-like antitoxin of type II toxin-antitoxin system [Phytobacter palmae]|uniref:ParD-like family protein n=1 Tax=Phytobacter palmae TaxID=1855371 RepID=A0ABU9V0B3_9ENTR|nr:ParD-like family protein [Escherichia coli]SFE27782.1 ParD-like antitoxin of type II toxin-antitoxin system [Phytobacter palmae]
MGIVKISDLMHENLRLASNALSRSINSQAEHWLKIGMLSELYPHLTHQELTRLLVRSELKGGVDINTLVDDEPLSLQMEHEAR